MQRLSSYAEAKNRYLTKISIIDGTDPLSAGEFGEEADVTPPVDACDLVYLNVVIPMTGLLALYHTS